MVPKPALEASSDTNLIGGEPLAVDEWLGDSNHPCDQDIDCMILWAEKSLGSVYFEDAIRQFYIENGKVFHDDHFYHQRMNYFMDMFIFEHVLPENLGSKTTFEIFQNKSTPLTSLSTGVHSIFQVIRVSQEKLVLKDLIANVSYEVAARPGESFRGIERGQVIQGFIYIVGSQKYLSKGVMTHPKSATAIIKKLAKKHSKSNKYTTKDILATIASFLVKNQRLAHVETRTIYKEILSQFS